MAKAKATRRVKATGRFETRKELARAVWDLYYEGGTDAGISRDVKVSANVVADILRNGPRMRRRPAAGVAPSPAAAAEPTATFSPVHPLRAEGIEVLDAEGSPVATAATAAIAEELAFAMNLTSPLEPGQRDSAKAFAVSRHAVPAGGAIPAAYDPSGPAGKPRAAKPRSAGAPPEKGRPAAKRRARGAA